MKWLSGMALWLITAPVMANAQQPIQQGIITYKITIQTRKVALNKGVNRLIAAMVPATTVTTSEVDFNGNVFVVKTQALSLKMAGQEVKGAVAIRRGSSM